MQQRKEKEEPDVEDSLALTTQNFHKVTEKIRKGLISWTSNEQ